MFVVNINSTTDKSGMARVRKLQSGDSFIVSHKDKTYHVGERYDGYNNLYIQKVWYSPRKWWQFWKKRNILGYTVACTKE